jgi:hypothetical protein
MIEQDSDKIFWHRYDECYSALFGRDFKCIVEFGVADGASIRWLSKCFPEAKIHGVDILPVRPEWTQGPYIEYHQVDQGDPDAVAELLRSIDKPDLIIEDGSHVPEHQSSCLRLGIRALEAGGAYILEDIHTSFESIDRQRRSLLSRLLSRFKRPPNIPVNSFAALYGLAHIRECGLGRDSALTHLSGGHFTKEDIAFLWDNVQELTLWRRHSLPLRCYACGSNDFDYGSLRCHCGANVFVASDSMTCVLHRS